MGIAGFYDHVASFWADINAYLNPFGRFYLKYQFFMRIVFMELLLSDIFQLTELICDTNQVGCQNMCTNRFNTITFQKLWESEFYISAMVTGIFIVFEMTQRKYLKRIRKLVKKGRSKEYLNSSLSQSMTRGRSVERGETEIVFSTYISSGYILMLAARLVTELWFLKIEYNLGVHQTGNTGILAWSYPEKYNCSTNQELNTPNELPNARSLFYIDEPLEACNQNSYVVPCWIPNSILKTKGLYFMVVVLLGGILLTLLELITAVIDSTKKKSKSYIDMIVDDAPLIPPPGEEISLISPEQDFELPSSEKLS